MSFGVFVRVVLCAAPSNDRARAAEYVWRPRAHASKGGVRERERVTRLRGMKVNGIEVRSGWVLMRCFHAINTCHRSAHTRTQ